MPIRDITPRDIKYNSTAKEYLVAGAEKLAEAVLCTLGPRGQYVVIDQSGKTRGIKVTKDGVSVARHVHLPNINENTGAQMLKEAAERVVRLAGDGTTTTTALASYILKEGYKHYKNNINPVIMGRGMDVAYNLAIKFIEENIVNKDLDIKDVIDKVSHIACNNDPALGSIVSEVMSLVGQYGDVRIIESDTDKTSYKIANGMLYDTGIGTTSSYFITDSKNKEWVAKDCIVVTSELTISDVNMLQSFLAYANEHKLPLLVIAKDFDSRVIQTIKDIHINGGIQVCLVRGLGYGASRRTRLKDIAMFTNGAVFSENSPEKLHNGIKHAGIAKHVVVGVEFTSIIEGGGVGSDKYKEYTKKALDKYTDKIDVSDKREYEKRIANLCGATAILKVGGKTEFEVNEKIDRIDDAVNAVRCALKGGIVPGGGITLMNAGEHLINNNDQNFTSTDMKVGYDLVANALKQPFKILLNNGGESFENILEYLNEVEGGLNKGYNLLTRSFTSNLIEEGIVDPFIVSKTALEAAISVAKTMLSTGCLINFYVNNEQDKDGFILPKQV